jgi:hypothetical protein
MVKKPVTAIVLTRFICVSHSPFMYSLHPAPWVLGWSALLHHFDVVFLGLGVYRNGVFVAMDIYPCRQ